MLKEVEIIKLFPLGGGINYINHGLQAMLVNFFQIYIL